MLALREKVTGLKQDVRDATLSALLEEQKITNRPVDQKVLDTFKAQGVITTPQIRAEIIEDQQAQQKIEEKVKDNDFGFDDEEAEPPSTTKVPVAPVVPGGMR